MEQYIEYLAENVLNEEKTISYRLLSRALKIHSNVAKQMLYDFHHKQNSKKKGTVHATYLISGRQKQRHSKTNGMQSQDTDGDHIMPSSPFPSSSAPQNSQTQANEEEAMTIRLITLAKEEDLDSAKAQFDEIDSVHIYSLAPGPVQDLQTLTDCNRRVAADFREDPLVAWKQYGTIQNSSVRRRTGKSAPSPPAATKPAPPVTKTQPKPAALVKKEEPAAPAKLQKEASTKSDTSAPSSQKSAGSKPPMVKRESSNIFKSFAKAKPKAAAKTSQEEASPVQFSDDEDDGGVDDDSMMLDEADAQKAKEAEQSRRDREKELKNMMDFEDEDDGDKKKKAKKEDEEDVEMEDIPDPTADGEGDDEVEEVKPKKEEPAAKEEKDQVTVSDGRRRGRRRVMKKKTVKDAEGYLVTREEPAWESFSEDEPAPPAKKAKLPTTSTFGAAAAAKGGAKKGGKPGQGNIMSFFAKK